jgi:transposase-like protein
VVDDRVHVLGGRHGMKSMRKRSQAERRQVVDAWNGSGLSVRDFCQQQGLAEGSFYGWRQQFGFGVKDTSPITAAHKQNGKSAIKFLPVQVKAPPATETVVRALTSERVEIFLDNGSVVRLNCVMSEENLSRIIKVAGTRTC